jgi:hypothetical protein
MIDIDDVADGGLFGGVVVLIILLIIYLVWSRPVINECHEHGGKIVRIEGKDQCVDVSSLKPLMEVK